MTNPVIHALVLIAAIIIPGGLLVYIAWRTKKNIDAKKNANVISLEEARKAFKERFPRDSLRAQSRQRRLKALQAYKHRYKNNSQ